jgi:glycosyltransferase involved in cell wall biosynthesis
VDVLLVDPPAFTPPYDHALAAALATAGANVRLLTSHFRHGPVPAADGYRREERLYRLSSRVGPRLPRLALRALEHPAALLRLATAQADVVHLQWLLAPEVDSFLLRARAPLVLTAHDLIPRRTAGRTDTWKRLFSRFARIVVHSEKGKRTLEAFGIRPDALRVIPHPVFASHPDRTDDGHTVAVIGSLRPYKGVPDAVAATLAVDGARLLVVGQPSIPLDELRLQAGSRAEWRLGWFAPREIERALGESTVAVFPYSAELDQSGALLQALGAGVPAVVYDVGGLGEVVAAFGAGRVVAPGDVGALSDALAELLGDPAALAATRAGAERARSELTWEAAAASHLALYEELL